MLIGAGKLVEQGCLSAVLVSGQGKGERRALRHGMLRRLVVEDTALTQTGMMLVAFFLFVTGLRLI